MRTLKDLCAGLIDLAERHPVYTPEEFLDALDECMAEFQESGLASVRCLGHEWELVSLTYVVGTGADYATFRIKRYGRKGYLAVYRSELAIARQIVHDRAARHDPNQQQLY